MLNKRKWILYLLPISLIFLGFYFASAQKETIAFPEEIPYENQPGTDLNKQAIQAEDDYVIKLPGMTSYKDKTLKVDSDFTSHLPVIVIDAHGQQPKHSERWDDEKQYYVPIEEDPYVQAEMYIYDNEDHINTIGSDSYKKVDMRMKIRGNSSSRYDKKQYLIKTEKKKNLLGMGKDKEWVLNVSFIDKSLLRNKLAYEAAGLLNPYTPDSRYCEVIWKNGDEYDYRGLYLLMENVRVGETRVDIPKSYDNVENPSALLRRDRYDPGKIMLENYGTVNKLTKGYLGLEYPDSENVSDKTVGKITKKIDDFEKALFSKKYEDMIAYREYIDIESFVDYFVLNEFFMNYDAGYNSTYMYMDYSGKIYMGPVWDFDQALDNDGMYAAKKDTTAFHATVWYDQLLRDPVFTKQVIERYEELRNTLLSDESIQKEIEKLKKHLGPAIDRDWARWGYFYKNPQYLKTENTRSHEEEVKRMSQLLLDHARWLDEHMDSLYQFKDVTLAKAEAMESKKQTDIKPLLAVVFVVVFAVSIHLVLRYENE